MASCSSQVTRPPSALCAASVNGESVGVVLGRDSGSAGGAGWLRALQVLAVTTKISRAVVRLTSDLGQLSGLSQSHTAAEVCVARIRAVRQLDES